MGNILGSDSYNCRSISLIDTNNNRRDLKIYYMSLNTYSDKELIRCLIFLTKIKGGEKIDNKCIDYEIAILRDLTLAFDKRCSVSNDFKLTFITNYQRLIEGLEKLKQSHSSKHTLSAINCIINNIHRTYNKYSIIKNLKQVESNENINEINIDNNDSITESPNSSDSTSTFEGFDNNL